MVSKFKLALPLLLFGTVAGGSIGAAGADPGKGPKDHRLIVLGALKDELARSKQKLRMTGEDGPYFIRYLVREYDDYDLSARFGALFEDSYQHVRQAAVEVRVGSYQFDNTADDSSEKAFDIDDFDRYEPPMFAPMDDNVRCHRAPPCGCKPTRATSRRWRPCTRSAARA